MEDDLKEDEDLSANIKEYIESSPFEVMQRLNSEKTRD
jgi:complement component 1 Q subcomponent-binding protein